MDPGPGRLGQGWPMPGYYPPASIMQPYSMLPMYQQLGALPANHNNYGQANVGRASPVLPHVAPLTEVPQIPSHGSVSPVVPPIEGSSGVNHSVDLVSRAASELSAPSEQDDGAALNEDGTQSKRSNFRWYGNCDIKNPLFQEQFMPVVEKVIAHQHDFFAPNMNGKARRSLARTE